MTNKLKIVRRNTGTMTVESPGDLREGDVPRYERSPDREIVIGSLNHDIVPIIERGPSQSISISVAFVDDTYIDQNGELYSSGMSRICKIRREGDEDFRDSDARLNQGRELRRGYEDKT